MMPIKILPEQLANTIAAGEVVERPASVVKELVENALDAGATDILVEIETGGKRLIRVTDNGCGMGRDDILLSLERHATSKIACSDDLFSLSTLGFRGEALPSIASVSRLTLRSRPPDQQEGNEIYVEGGKVREVKSCGMPHGTVVEVRNLFFNTPARLKFLKTTETEAGHVGDLLARLAISSPSVRFRYLHDSRCLLNATSRQVSDRVAEVVGSAHAHELYPCNWANGQLSVIGLLGRPDFNRSSPSSLYTYINGRFIRDRVVQHAIMHAYRSFLEKGRYPVVVLYFSLPPGDVDVNVHPTKHEVRFRDQGMVHDFLAKAVSTTLEGTPWVQRVMQGRHPDREPATQPDRHAAVREALSRYVSSKPAPSFISSPSVTGSAGAAVACEVPPQEPASRPSAPQQGSFFSNLTILGQFRAAYILCQDDTDLILIDQHAAHERVAFERLKREFSAGSVEVQGLLFPETVQLSHHESALLREHGATIELLGFILEEFGGTSWVLSGVPRMLAAGNYGEALHDLLEEMSAVGRSHAIDEAVESALIRIACHSVVRGRHQLTVPEIRSLFAQMDVTDFASNCPHGRPVIARIAAAQIEKLFNR